MKSFLVVVGVVVFQGALAQVPEPDCLIGARSMIEVVAPVDGMIADILVTRGDRVGQGDVLVQLEDTVERLQVELASARASSTVEIEAQEARLDLRQREYERVRQLLERNAISATALDDAEVELRLMHLALEKARLARVLDEIELRQAGALVERKRITNSIDGIVVDVSSSPGEFVTDQSDIMVLAEIDPLYIEVFAPAELYGLIAPGTRHQVTLSAPLPLVSYPFSLFVVRWQIWGVLCRMNVRFG